MRIELLGNRFQNPRLLDHINETNSETERVYEEEELSELSHLGITPSHH